jgi:hypothetical protein
MKRDRNFALTQKEFIEKNKTFILEKSVIIEKINKKNLRKNINKSLFQMPKNMHI